MMSILPATGFGEKKPGLSGIRRLLCLLPVFVCLLTACGDTWEKPTLGTNGFLYVAERLAPPVSEYPPDNFRSDGTYLYYLINRSLYRVPLGEKISFASQEHIFAGTDGSGVVDYTFDKDGGIYCFIQNFTYNADWNMVPEDCSLVRLSQDGTVVGRSELPGVSPLMNTASLLAGRQEGQVFLLVQEGIYVMDSEGNLLAVLSTEEYRPQDEYGREQLLTDGSSIYYLSGGGTYTLSTLYEITQEDSFQLARRDGILKDMSGTFYSSSSGLLCNKEDGILYQYSADEGVWKEKLRWGDSSLIKDVSAVVETSPDTLLAHYFFFGAPGEDALFFLTKTPLEDLPQKEILVLATTRSWSGLDAALAEYNQSNDKCHIILDIYEGEEELARLDGALVSGNPPDLLDLSGLDITKYAQKQLLEDLNLYLEKSSVLKREDFLESILDGFTIDEKLYGIPDSFYFTSLLGRTSQVGSSAGWTLEDLMALTEKYPDSRLLNSGSFEYALENLLRSYILEEFINWETGACSFDSPEFCSLIRWMQEHTRNIYLSYEEGMDYSYGVVPADMLLVRKYVDSPRHYALMTYDWDEPFTLIGCPTKDGTPSYGAGGNNAVAIVSRSGSRDQAWDFLEFFLTRQEQDPFGSFSSRRDVLYQDIEEETEPLYDRDENGEILIYEHFWVMENGQWVEHWNESRIRPRQFQYVDGEEIPYYYMEKERADILLEFLEQLDFTPKPHIHSEIFEIIMEETAPFLNGDKSLEEAVHVVQNRVSALVQESL